MITNLEATTVLRLGFPKDITEKIINIIKENTLYTKMYLLALELETKTLFNRYVIYYIDEDDMSEIFCYDPEGDDDRSYGEHYSYIDYGPLVLQNHLGGESSEMSWSLKNWMCSRWLTFI